MGLTRTRRGRPRRGALWVVAAATVLVGVSSADSVAALPGPPIGRQTPSGAGSEGAGSEGAAAVDPPPGEGLSLAVAAVPASSSELDAAEVERDRLLARQGAATEESGRTVAELSTVDTERGALAQLVARRDEQILKADAVHARLRGDLRVVAIEWFITGFDVTKALDPTLTSEERDALSRARVLSEAAAEDTVSDEQYSTDQRAALRSDRERMDERRVELDARSGELAARRDRLETELVELTGRLERNAERVAEARMTATIDGTDLSTAALDAYWRAARVLSLVDPSCGVRWWALAGIGRTESRHGTYRGASVGRDGTVAPPIYGPDLDGSNTFRVVPDSDGGALDATSTTDRAVGPMQFLPGTWRTVGRDGSGDGRADPQNLYDASVSAGVYLCRSGPGLGDEARLRAAYLTYNRSLEYVDIVMDHAHGYAASVDLPR